MWFRSFLLKKEIELTEVYEMSDIDRDMIIIETQTAREDPEVLSRPELRAKYLAAGYFYHLATLVSSRKTQAQK